MTRPRYYTAKAAAAYLGMTYKAFDAYVRRHHIPFARIDSHRRFTAETIDRIKAARQGR